MPALSFVVVVLFIGLLWVSHLANHIPSTGRDANADGEKITATITNYNKTADRASVLRAEKDGRKFKVKLKPSEARPWIKGDQIEILLSDKKDVYRILFTDYFRKNEQRIRKFSLENLKKANKWIVSKNLTGYKEEYFALFEKSSFDSLQIFAFTTYMRMINIYSVAMALIVVAAVLWWQLTSPSGETLIAAALLVLLMIWTLYNTVQNCKKLIRKAEGPVKDKKEQI